VSAAPKEPGISHLNSTPRKGKSDLILAAVLRMERFLERMDSKISSHEESALRASSGEIPSPVAPFSISSGHRENLEFPFHSWLHNVQNASISRLHTSTTESILEWPHFTSYQTLRHGDAVSIFNLEQARPPLVGSRQSPMLPFASTSDINTVIRAFQLNINFWYPTMAKTMLDPLKDKLATGNLGNDCDSCLAFLLMALGCACESTACAFQEDQEGIIGPDFQPQRRKMGEMYFDCAMNRMHVAYQEVSRSALHCLLFTA